MKSVRRLPVLALFFVALVARLYAQSSGLDAPEPVGAFLNGVFPSQTPGAAGDWAATPTFTGLSLVLPMMLTPYPGTNKLAVVEHAGRILLFDNNPAVATSSTFLDIRSRVFEQSDSGMTAIAFHPQFGQTGSANRGYVYVTYKWRPSADDSNAYWRLSRFTVPDGQQIANSASELVLIQQYDRQEWHDSGCLLFGPDGYLYIGIGDEGYLDDTFDVGQKTNERLFSGVLRIDVDNNLSRSHAIRRQPTQVAMASGWPNSYTQGYTIPNDNPFVDSSGGTLEEFYAIGLRNPYKFTYDAVSGKMFLGDVGQTTREELNLLVKGGNYGWPFQEGTIAGPKPAPAVIKGTLQAPYWDYDRDVGTCIVSGFVYRGAQNPSLVGKLIAADYGSGRIWAISIGGAPPVIEELTTMPFGCSSVSVDANGEIYFCKTGDIGGAGVYKLGRAGSSTADPPALLSQTGAFTSLASLTPASGVIPYTVNTPLWSDNAAKKRWVALPNNGTHDTAAEKILFAPDAEWTFPPGTVFVKHFELPVNDANPSVLRRLETRFFVISATGEPYGVTYKWRPDGSNADLLTAGLREDVTITTTGGGTRTQPWDYPSRADCMQCHNGNAKYILGVKTHQLNGNFTYPKTGRTANQLRTLGALGWFDNGYRPDLLPFFLQSRAVTDTTAPLELRVRSYLDANCAQCHRPNGARAFFDARFTTPLPDQGMISGVLEGSYTGTTEAPILPNDVPHSIIHYRANQTGALQMPPLAKNVVDTTAMQTLQSWITSLATGPTLTLTGPPTAAGDFNVSVTFKQSVTGLTTSDFIITHGSALSLTGSGASYTLRIRPVRENEVSVRLPAGAAINAALKPNYASPTLRVGVQDGNLVTWLKLDEQSGYLPLDSSQSALDVIVHSVDDTDWVAGKFSNALRLNTPGQRIEFQNLLGDNFTVSFWLNTTQTFPTTDTPAAGYPLIFADGGASNGFGVTAMRSAGGVNRIGFHTGRVASGVQTVIRGTSSVSTGAWRHVSVTREKATGVMKLYVDGVQEASGTGGTDSLNAAALMSMGANPNNTALSYAGMLDQIRLYSRALSASEVAQLAAAGSSGALSFEQWIALELPGLTHLYDPALDSDLDGTSAFKEFSFGGNPARPDAIPVLITRNANGTLTLQFRARDSLSGLAYTLFSSTNMVNWTPAGAAFGNLRYVDISASDYQWVIGDYTLPTPAPAAIYFRVEAAEVP